MANLTQPAVQMDRPQLKVNKQFNFIFLTGEKSRRFMEKRCRLYKQMGKKFHLSFFKEKINNKRFTFIGYIHESKVAE